MKINSRAFVILAVITAIVAVLRYFMKGWVQPLGVSDTAGSFIASVTIVMLIGMLVLFIREGRATVGSYWRAVGWFSALALWSEILIAAAVLITARTGSATYYQEMLGSHVNLSPVRHALSHLIVTILVAIVGSILGAPFYFIAKRGRRGNVAPGV